MAFTDSSTLLIMTPPRCRHCNHWILPRDRFCESCGSAVPRPACPTCGASAEKADDEGFCISCGFRHVQAPDQRAEVLSEDLAGLSDRGLHHSSNQDAFSLVQLPQGQTVLTVCDGISSSPRAELAAQTAAIVIAHQLALEPSIQQAIEQAQREVAALSSTHVESPSTTLVSAVVEPCRNRAHASPLPQVKLAWLGDSRAYWLSSPGSQHASRQLTQDHANADQALTRWLGGDAQLSRDPPQLSEFQIPGPGYLLLCSDGLWKYTPEPEQLQQQLYAQIPEPECPPPTESLVRSLVQFANQQGGHDNITAVLQRF